MIFPTIDTSNGGVGQLGLVAVDGITSDAPGGTLTFSGLNLLAIATVNGSIDLGSEISFDGLDRLVMYARGSGSNISIISPISNVRSLRLLAEGSIQVSLATLDVANLRAMTGGGNLTVQLGSLLLDGQLRLDVDVLGGMVSGGASIDVFTAGDLINTS